MAGSRHIRAFRFPPELIQELLMGNCELIPIARADLTIERYGYEWADNSAIVMCSHPSWPEVNAGELITPESIMVRSRTYSDRKP